MVRPHAVRIIIRANYICCGGYSGILNPINTVWFLIVRHRPRHAFIISRSRRIIHPSIHSSIGFARDVSLPIHIHRWCWYLALYISSAIHPSHLIAINHIYIIWCIYIYIICSRYSTSSVYLVVEAGICTAHSHNIVQKYTPHYRQLRSTKVARNNNNPPPDLLALTTTESSPIYVPASRSPFASIAIASSITFTQLSPSQQRQSHHHYSSENKPNLNSLKQKLQ